MFENYQNDAVSASLGTRFLNSLIDGIVINVLIFLTFILLAPILISSNTQQISPLISYSISFIFYLTYYVFFEGLFQRTPAKFITSTKVITGNGEKPDFSVIFIRTLIRLVPFEALSFLFGDSNGWHDRWSKTAVVSSSHNQNDSKLPPPPPPPKF